MAESIALEHLFLSERGPALCSVSTSQRNGHLRALIQLTAQIQPVRTVL